MEFRHFRYFVTMAECGSLMKASERLHVAQPALSVHLANIEANLGVKLFDRSSRGIELTEAGKQLYDKAVVLLRYHHDLLDSVRSSREVPRGAVSIGLPSTCSAVFSPAIYRAMRSQLPDVNLYIMDASTAILYEWVKSGRLDLVVLLNVPEQAGLDATPLCVEEICLAGVPNNVDDSSEIEFEAIFDRPLVVPCAATTYRKMLDDIAVQKGKAFRPALESDSFEVIRSIAISGQADAVLPRHCLHADLAAGRLRARRLINPEVRGLLSIAHVSERSLDCAQRAVRDLVIKISHDNNGSLLTAITNNVMPLVRTLPSTVLPAHRKSPRLTAVH